jgi:hypothetical protein
MFDGGVENLSKILDLIRRECDRLAFPRFYVTAYS